MDEYKRNSLKQRSNPQFKRKGGSKNAKLNFSSHERSSENSQSSDTTYCILCHSKKVGSVIGKGGSIIKALREETQAKITVADSVPGSDDRIVIISSPSTKLARRQNNDKNNDNPETKEENYSMEPHCAAQDALLKVHNRIVEEDLLGVQNEDKSEAVIITRLLVPNNLVGCLLGRKGDVIQKLRSETGASIRVLSAEHLPACAMTTDELVQGAVRECDHPSYPDLPIATRFSNIRSPPEMKFPDHSYGTAKGTGGYNIDEFAGSSARYQEPRSIGPGFIDDIRGTSDRMNAGHNVFHGSSENLNAGRPTFQGYGSPAGQSSNIHQGAYHQNYAAQQSAYQSYPAKGGYPSGSPSQLPYQNANPHQAPYQNINSQQHQHQQAPPPYQNMAAQGSYHY